MFKIVQIYYFIFLTTKKCIYYRNLKKYTINNTKKTRIPSFWFTFPTKECSNL